MPAGSAACLVSGFGGCWNIPPLTVLSLLSSSTGLLSSLDTDPAPAVASCLIKPGGLEMLSRVWVSQDSRPQDGFLWFLVSVTEIFRQQNVSFDPVKFWAACARGVAKVAAVAVVCGLAALGFLYVYVCVCTCVCVFSSVVQKCIENDCQNLIWVINSTSVSYWCSRFIWGLIINSASLCGNSIMADLEEAKWHINHKVVSSSLSNIVRSQESHFIVIIWQPNSIINHFEDR